MATRQEIRDRRLKHEYWMRRPIRTRTRSCRVRCDLCKNPIDVGELYYDSGFEHRAHVECAVSLTDFDPRKHVRAEQSDVDASNLYFRVKELEDENDKLRAVVEAARTSNAAYEELCIALRNLDEEK